MPTPERSVKTLAIRLDEELHARLSVLAQLADITITDAIRQAIEAWVETARGQGNLAARATGVLEDIEREATARRDAIQALFGEAAEPAAESESASAPAKARGRKAATGQDDTER